MIIDACVYLLVFGITVALTALFQKSYNAINFNLSDYRSIILKPVFYCFVGCLFMFPIIAMFALRYGIGADYFNYELIFRTIHATPFNYYLSWHINDVSDYYAEPGYALLNMVFSTYRALLWGIGILLSVLFLVAVKDYSKKISFAFALFIYLSTQFIYSLNGVRFAIAVLLILIGYNYLSKNRIIPFVIMVGIAALFHKTSLFCLAMIFLKRFKSKKINTIRNYALFIMIMSFPLLSKYLFTLLGSISIFQRYFTADVYSASESMSSGWMWVLHILPVMLPLLILCRKEIFSNEDTDTLFRICIVEIPFRMLGLYNTWYTRYTRCSQIAQVIFIPLVLSRIENRQKRNLMYVYYVVWYIFYFFYYAIINDRGDSLPYVWIFSH